MIAKRLVWVSVVIAAVCAVVETAINAAVQPLWSEGSVAVHGWPLVPAAALASAILGALVVTRYPRQPIGWLLNLVGFTTMVSLLGEIYGIWVVEEAGPGPLWLGQFANWVAQLLGGPMALSGLMFIFLLSPDGRLLSRRWRYVVIIWAVGFSTFLVGLLALAPSEVPGRQDPATESGPVAWVISVGSLLIMVALLASVVSMGVRLRRLQGAARQQLKWVAVSAAGVVVGLVVILVGQLMNGGQQTWATSLPLFASYLLFAVGVAISMLRYQLYDIDLIISRAVLVAAATVFVACAYVVLVVGVAALFGPSEERFWPSLIATAVVAMAFQPVRRRVVRFANRLAYGEQAAPYDALAAFSRRIGGSPAPERLLPAVAEAAARAVAAVEATARLDLPGDAARLVRWSQDELPGLRTAEVVIPVSDQGGDLGAIAVTLPAGRDLRPVELRLLHDIAEQAALAFRNARLEAELAAHAEVLTHRTDELAASRRRLIQAGDDERSRLAASIAREVLPKLAELRSDLVRTGSGELSEQQAIGFVERATEALEALRILTQGIFPTMLARAGLGPALSSYFARRQRAQTLVIDQSAVGRRFPSRAEAAAYFCCTEVTSDDSLEVTLKVVEDWLAIELRAAHLALDRQAVLDRVEASGGRLEDAGDAGAAGRRLRLLLPAGSSAS